MNAIPEDAQRSEDGLWWWDGTDWRAVDAQPSDAGESGAGLAPVSEDHFAQMLDAAEGEAAEA